MEYDTDVNHYTDQELLDLLEIEQDKEVPVAAQMYIEKYSSNPELVKFYTDIRSRFEAKNTPEIKKGILNAKHLNNTISRMINIDSTFREYSSNYVDDSKNFLFKLNEPITNVISLMLYSIEIPQGWYTFELAKGNTVFQPILIVQNNTVPGQEIDTFDDTSIVTKYVYPMLQINDGNYTSKSLVKDVTKLIQTCGIFVNQPDTFRIEQDVYTGRSKLTVTKDFLMQKIILPNTDPSVPSENLNTSVYSACKIGFLFHSVPLKTKVNYNLGWLLGFREAFYTIKSRLYLGQDKDTIDYSESIIDTAGTKYIILQLDDFKTNRMNKNVVNISTKTDQTIPLPPYYNRSLPQFQTSTTTVNVTSNTIGLTEKQIYTINSINDSYNTDITAIQVSFPNISDIFAKIPLKNHMEWGIVEADGTYNCCDSGPGKIIVEFSGPLQLATREYFGPVDITSFSVTLYDDKGFPLSLNGLDWSFTMIAKSIINNN